MRNPDQVAEAVETLEQIIANLTMAYAELVANLEALATMALGEDTDKIDKFHELAQKLCQEMYQKMRDVKTPGE